MNRRKKSILIAMVIGDGYIRNDYRVKNHKCTLKFCHSIKQKDYLQHKVNLLHSLLGGKKPKIREYTCHVNGKSYKQVRAEKTHRIFRVLRKHLYPDKYAMIKYLDEEGLAIWFMDVGSCVVNHRYPDGSVSSCRTNLHICVDTREQAKQVCNYFMKKWGIKWKPYKEGRKFSIRCFHKEGRKFHELIHPYIIPSMQYKQRFYYGTSAQPLRS